MPKGTTLRNFRADDTLWRRARAVAEAREESLSDVLRAALEEYVTGPNVVHWRTGGGVMVHGSPDAMAVERVTSNVEAVTCSACREFLD